VTWIHRLRLRVLAWMLGIGLAGIALVSWLAVPAWPVVGFAVAVVVATVSSMTSRLASPTCLSCGNNLSDALAGEHGLVCPECGAITRTLALRSAPESSIDWVDQESEQV